MLRLLTLIVALALPLPAPAQDWPSYDTIFVNDKAGLIDPATEARLAATLAQVRATTGIEATVLTIRSRQDYAPTPSLEAFTTGLFNAWGIGSAATDDGILILVAAQDRETRIELGAGYGSAFNRVAQAIVDDVFLPAFRAGDFAGGIEAGTLATLDRIGYAHLAER